MRQAKEGDISFFLSREIEAAEEDPLNVELNAEFFPLRGRVRQFDWNATAKVSIPRLDQIGIEPEVKFTAGGPEWAKLFISRHIKESDTFETINTFTIQRHEDEELPSEFTLGLGFIAKGDSDQDIQATQETMRSSFRIRVTNHLTGQNFYADTTYQEVASLYGHIWFLVDKFNEVDESGNVIAVHQELKFPNQEAITQQIGVTFESVEERTA